MYTFEDNIYYFGKLRRRREFLKGLNSIDCPYEKWEKWFARCSSSNLLVPFLDNREKLSSSWLFLDIEDETLSCGLTKQSIDMSGRKYPFLIYTSIDSKCVLTKEILFKIMHFMAIRNQKFDDIVALGDIKENQYSYFIASENCSVLIDQDISLIEQMANHAFVYITAKETGPVSFWLNVHSLKYIEHNNALTCSLYNKIYG